MAHKVTFLIPERTLGRSDVEFKVKHNDKTLGELKVSKGSLVWFPADKSWGHRVTWRKFNELMETSGKKEEKR